MSYASTVLATADLLAFWPFDEPSGATAADAFGSADLAIAGGVTLGGDPLVHGGTKSATFARAASGRASSSTSYHKASVSVEGRFRLDDLTVGPQCFFFNGSGTNRFGLLRNGFAADGRLHVLFQGDSQLNTQYSPDVGPHHLVLTRAAIGEYSRLPVDGAEVFAQPTSYSNPPSGGFTLGVHAASGTNALTGAIDDVSVYWAVPDVSTVLAHYQAAIGILPVEPRTPMEAWESHLHDRHHTGPSTYEAGEGYRPTFDLVVDGARNGQGELERDYASSHLNSLVAHKYAWAYWHRKVVLGDQAGGRPAPRAAQRPLRRAGDGLGGRCSPTKNVTRRCCGRPMSSPTATTATPGPTFGPRSRSSSKMGSPSPSRPNVS